MPLFGRRANIIVRPVAAPSLVVDSLVLSVPVMPFFGTTLLRVVHGEAQTLHVGRQWMIQASAAAAGLSSRSPRAEARRREV